jgi:hypothetical protein
MHALQARRMLRRHSEVWQIDWQRERETERQTDRQVDRLAV